MAKGKPWTKEQREKVVRALKEYLEIGFSRNRACKMVGLAPTTLSQWVTDDDALRMELQGYENLVDVMVMKNLKQSIHSEQSEKDTKKENSKWWAERKMKDEFATRTDITSNDLPIGDIEEKAKAIFDDED